MKIEVFVAPLQFQPTNRCSLQPDLLVVRKEDIGDLVIEEPLLLAGQIFSPSTRAKDPLVKPTLYDDSGVASMWVVDLDEPSITGGCCGTVAGATSAARLVEVLAAELPCPAAATPASLL